MRKPFAMLLALTMVFSLAITAFAEDGEPVKNNSITITKAIAGETYKLYKLFDLVVDDEYEPTSYTYTVNPDWSAFFAADGAKYVTINEYGAVTAIKDEAGVVTNDAKDLAKAAETWATTNATEQDSKTAAGEIGEEVTVIFSGLDNGYYLITSTLGTVAMTETTPDKNAVSIDEKNPVDTIEKKVQEDSNSEWRNKENANDAQVGDTVNFKSTVTLNPFTTNVKVHDTMDDGLTYNNDVKVYTDVDCTEELATSSYTVQATPDSGDTFTIKFDEAYLAGLTAQTKLYLEYTAVLNQNAVKKDNNGVAIVDQYNRTTITYGDAQSVEDFTKTTTHKVVVDKYADGVENLAGAVFQLKKNEAVVNLVKLNDTNYRIATSSDTTTVSSHVTNTGTLATVEAGSVVSDFVTVSTGDIVIWGLDSDSDYTLVETKAPAGYNTLNAEVNVEFDTTNKTFKKVDVENKTGTVLPSTGGMGTTLFYIVGGIMAVGAAVLLVTKKRMSAN